jgi:hypothetical protein
MIESVANKHSDCQMAVRWKLFRNKTSPTPGLFCSCHDVFLDWLPEKLAYELIDVHHLPVETYVERKKKPKPSLPKGRKNVLKSRKVKNKKIKKAKASYKLKFGSEMPK